MSKKIVSGALVSYIEGAYFMTGNWDHNPTLKSARLAIQNGTVRRYGPGYTLTIEDVPDVVDVITGYAETVLSLREGFSDAEIRAAQRWIDSL